MVMMKKLPTGPLPQRPKTATPSGLDPQAIINATQDNLSFVKADKNHDNSLSATELAADGAPQVGHRSDEKRFAKYDKDHNGAISSDEYQAGRAKDRKKLSKLSLQAEQTPPIAPGVGGMSGA